MRYSPANEHFISVAIMLWEGGVDVYQAHA